ncbi:hypothetical protein GCM10020331_042460 [Ectobacillus funiculus]
MRRFIGILACFTLLCSAAPVGFAQSEAKPKQPVQKQAEASQPKLVENASSAVLLEQDTGKVLFNKKNSNEKLPPSEHDENYDDAAHYGTNRQRKA